MSRYQIALVRAALIYLVLTGALGLLFIAAPASVAPLRVTHVHAGLLGFFLSLVMGVALWLLPRPGGARDPGAEARIFWSFHVGLALRMVVEPWARWGGPAWLQAPLMLAGVLLLAGIAAFALAAWPRLRSPGALRELRASRRS